MFLAVAKSLLNAKLTAAGVDHTHGMDHAEAVFAHAARAVQDYEELSEVQRNAVLLAALLHDADDAKYFQDTENAREIAQSAGADAETVELVCEMIDLVSTRKNKNTTVPAEEEWKLIPRWCDRLEAMGTIGVQRCVDYAKRIRNPMRTPETAVCRTRAEVDAVATPERFAAYNGESASIIDHFYDKLLHLRRGITSTQSRYLMEEAERRHQVLVDYVLLYSVPAKVTVFEKKVPSYTFFGGGEG